MVSKNGCSKKWRFFSRAFNSVLFSPRHNIHNMALRKIIGYSVRRAQYKIKRSASSMFDMFDQYLGPHNGASMLRIYIYLNADKDEN